MLKIKGSDISKLVKDLDEAIKTAEKAPLMHEDVLKEVLPRYHEDWGIEYPKEIKLPPNKEGLRVGSREPSRIIRITEPIMSKLYNVPMWFGTTSKEIHMLGIGYKNGDKRFPCDITIDDNDIHTFNGGKTGQGKSVALNSIILALCYLYPPWEIRFVMSDAKVIEFSKYMGGFLPPHIASISAATDPNYILSMLNYYEEEMKFYNSAYSQYGKLGNIEEFRKETGFALARTFIVVDEVTATLEYADKRAALIEKAINKNARLGRNTGYHLLLTSQDPASVPQAILDNINVRGALGCVPDVSTKIIGNSEASIYLGEKGRMIINTDPTSGEVESNIHYRVPFLHPDEFERQLSEISALGKEYNYNNGSTSYNENYYITEDQYVEALRNEDVSPHSIYLGEPSFVYKEADSTGMFKIKLNFKDQENILVAGINSNSTLRFVKSVLYSLNATQDKSNANIYTINGDSLLDDYIDISKFSTVYEKVRSIDDVGYRKLKDIFSDKYFAVNADILVFDQDFKASPDVRELLEKISTNPEELTEINIRRASAIVSLMKRTPFLGYFPQDLDFQVSRARAILAQLYKPLGCLDGKRLNSSRYKKMYVQLYGFNKINGLGFGNINKEVPFFTFMLTEASQIGMHFTVTAFDKENITTFKNNFRYFLFEINYNKAWARTVCGADIPDNLKEVLACVRDNNDPDEDPMRFKRFAMEGESFV